jgi:hypothetical protein
MVMTARNYTKLIVIMIVCFTVMFLLTACTGETSDTITPEWNFLGVESVSCDEPFLLEPTTHPFDGITPGQSTSEDVLNLLASPTEQRETNSILTWLYELPEGPSPLSVYFRDDKVVRRNEPRARLGEIVAHYGVPTQIYWELPRFYFDESIPRTYLLYPEQGAFFVQEEQIVNFASDTIFRLSFIVASDEFDNLLVQMGHVLKESDYEEYVQLEWPCPVTR